MSKLKVKSKVSSLRHNPKVPSKVFEAWNQKKTRGDVLQLINYTGNSKPVIIRAIRHGIASSELIFKISHYYSQKKIESPDEIEVKALQILNNAI